MAEELFTEFRQRITEIILVPSSGGVFEVEWNGKLIFSKKSKNRHAEKGELIRLLKKEIG
ncbi:SelT/SelW/SelH family protein [Kroppenstedtia pulmonis]|uniref:SelT/SelW/SelH family protein n=1 Tax=Kroppenstedtia pulmonis TaxID=1380685 RepID=A0A7D3XIJ6_9BACL|nr:SelT/SelW/SelH family protein [Kroppenstedtia pulmonis]